MPSDPSEPQPPATHYDVFLSYNREDQKLAQEITRKLEQRGLRVWIDSGGLHLGKAWLQELEKIIGQVRAALILISPAGIGRWQRIEIDALVSLAVEHENLTLIPLLLPGSTSKDLPVLLTRYTWQEFRRGEFEEEILDRLAASIRGSQPPWIGKIEKQRERSYGAKFWSWVLAPVLALGAGLAGLAWWNRPAPARPSAAVLTFVNESGLPRLDWLSAALPEVLGEKLGMGGAVRIVDRQHVVLSEIDLGLNAAPTMDLARDQLERLDGLVGARYAITGAFEAVGESSLHLTLKILDMENGLGVQNTEETGEEGSWVELVDRASGALPESKGNFRRFLQALPLSADQAAALRAAFPKSLEAARLYGDAVARAHRFDPAGAESKLREAAAKESHPRILAALATAQYYLGLHDQAKTAAAQARQGMNLLSPEEQQKLISVAARLDQDPEAILGSAKILFRTLSPDDINRGIDYAARFFELGAPEQVPRLVTELATLRGGETQPEIPLLASRAYRLLDDLPQAAKKAKEALERAEKLGADREAALAKMDLGRVTADLRSPAEATKILGEAQLLFRKVGDRLNAARCLELAARVAQRDNLPLAEDLVRQALAIYESANSRRNSARVLLTLHGMLLSQGKKGEAATAAQRSKELAATLWFTDADGDDLYHSGYSLHLAGKLDQARYDYLNAASIYSRAGKDEYYGAILANVGELELTRGRFEEAKNYLQQALALHTADPAGLSYDQFQMGRLYAATGDYVVAESSYTDAVEHLESPRDDVAIAEIELAQAELALALGQLAKCASIAAGAEQKLRAGNENNLSVNADALLARCLARQGDLKAAREKVEALRNLEVYDFRSEYGRQLAIAQLDAEDGREGLAFAALGQLAVQANAAGHLLFELEILLTLGEIEFAHGRQAAGRKRLEQLAARAKNLGVGQIQRRVEAALQSSGISSTIGTTSDQAVTSPDSKPSAKMWTAPKSGVDTVETLLSC